MQTKVFKFQSIFLYLSGGEESPDSIGQGVPHLNLKSIVDIFKLIPSRITKVSNLGAGYCGKKPQEGKCHREYTAIPLIG